MKLIRHRPKKVYFRKWLNKKYAVFNSIGKRIKICSLSFAYTLLIAPVNVKGENDSISIPSREYDLEEITVTESLSPILDLGLARIVNIIPAVDIKRSPSQSINDYLDYLPGIDVRTRGPLGVQADISMRGATFEQTTFLLNGVKITDPQTGHNSMNLPVDINAINRIEIIKGPANRVFGAGANNDAVNIVCNPMQSNYIITGISIGEYGFYNINAQVNTEIKNTRHLLAVNHNKSDGYIDNTDFKIYNVYYHSVVNMDKGDLNIQAGYQDKSAGAQNFYTRSFPSQFERMRTKFASISFETGEKITWKPLVYIRRGHDRFELYREDPDYYTWQDDMFINRNTGDTAMSFYKGHNYHMNTVYGFENHLSYHSSLGTSSLGLEYRSENILSNTMGNLTDTIKAPGEQNGYFYKKRRRNNTGCFVEHKVILNNFSVNGGMLLHWSSDFGWYIFPGLDITYNVSKKTRMFININKSARLPSFTELYYNTSTHLSNPELKPENSSSAEAGWLVRGDIISGYTSIFIIDGKNLIDWVQDTGQFVSETEILKWESKNITSSTTLGTEVKCGIDIEKLINERFPVKNINIGYTFMNKETSSSGYVSAYTLDYLKHKANLEMKILYRKLYLTMIAAIHDRNEYYDWILKKEIIFQPYILVDSKLSYETGNLKIYFDTNNMLNCKYFDYSGVEMPGRWIKFGFLKKFLI